MSNFGQKSRNLGGLVQKVADFHDVIRFGDIRKRNRNLPFE